MALLSNALPIGSIAPSVGSLTTIRANASRFFVWFLWLHVPLLAIMALGVGFGHGETIRVAEAMAAAALAATIAYRINRASLPTRLVIALAMTVAPALFVYVGRGPWQSDWHMYFFIIFAMLAAYVDMRPVFLSAVATAVHHVVLNALFPQAVFSEPGIGRALFHAAIVAVECAVLFWVIKQRVKLFVSSKRAVSLMEQALSERATAFDALVHTAWHDSLTGLPTRARFFEQADVALARLRTGECTSVAVLFIDCDRLKVVNDTRGHEAGDLLLQAFAKRLARYVAPGALLARLGGDEFTFLLCGTTTVAWDAVALARTIVEDLARPFEFANMQIALGASVGIAEITLGDDVPSPATLIRDADLAMYRAKTLGGNRFEYFNRELQIETSRRRLLEATLPEAIALEQLSVVYQPIVALDTERVVGCEALVRWTSPELGEVEPSEFIAIAEESNVIVAIGAFVLRSACAQMAHLLAISDVDASFSMSVNVSVKQLRAPGFVDEVVAVLATYGLSGSRLNLEITESLLMSASVASTAVLADLRSRGIAVHLDDFGTGYSSLAYLHTFPIQRLKIDGSFVTGGSDRGVAQREIVRTILALADYLGLSVTAEGVETADQARELREMGCTRAQGYLFSRPISADALTARLVSQSRGMRSASQAE